MKQGFYWMTLSDGTSDKLWLLSESEHSVRVGIVSMYGEPKCIEIEQWHEEYGDLDESLLCAIASSTRGYDDCLEVKIFDILKDGIVHFSKQLPSENNGRFETPWETAEHRMSPIARHKNASIIQTLEPVFSWDTSSEDGYGWDEDYENSEESSEES